MFKKLRLKQKNNIDYVDMIGYFEPKIGYSRANRTAFSYLLGDGFLLSCWEPFCDQIAISNEPFPMLVKNITSKEPCALTKGALLELASNLAGDKLVAYVYRQTKLFAQKEVLSTKGLYGKLGINERLVEQSRSKNRFASIIDDVYDAYWKENDGVLKIKTIRGGKVAIKYQNVEIKIGMSGDSQQLSSYAYLQALILDICNSNDVILDIKQRNNATDLKYDKLFELFRPDKVLKEFGDACEVVILKNDALKYISDGYRIVFGCIDEEANEAMRGNSFKEEYEKVLDYKIKEQIERRFASNCKVLQERNASFTLIFLRLNRIKIMRYKILFNMLPIFKEWSEYLLSMGDAVGRAPQHISTPFLNYLAEKYPKKVNFSARDITRKDFVEFLNTTTVEQGVASQLAMFLKNMYDFLMNNKSQNKLAIMGPLPEPPVINAIKDIMVKKPDKKQGYQPMPEGVFDKILACIDRIEPTLKNAFKLIAATGMRSNELEGITSDSLVEKGGEVKLLVWEYKKENRLTRKGKKPIREIVLYDSEVIRVFREQVEESEMARKASGIESIFVRKDIKASRYGIVGNQHLNVEINRLIRINNISGSSDGKLWKYNTYQLRVSLVVEMIEKGASYEQLKTFFSWSDVTMQQAYLMARKRKIMEMNTDFFRREFAIPLHQNAIDQYGEDELQEIVAMFYATSREMAYGKCMRHPSQGVCGKLHEASACAPCHNIKVTPQHRAKWEELYNLKYREVKRLRLFYEQRGCGSEEYEKYEFYIVQSGILESYANVLVDIDGLDLKRAVKWHA